MVEGESLKRIITELDVYREQAVARGMFFYLLTVTQNSSREKFLECLRLLEGIESVLIVQGKNEHMHGLIAIKPIIGGFKGFNAYIKTILLESFNDFRLVPKITHEEIITQGYQYILSGDDHFGEEFIQFVHRDRNTHYEIPIKAGIPFSKAYADRPNSTELPKLSKASRYSNLLGIVELWLKATKSHISDGLIFVKAPGSIYTYKSVGGIDFIKTNIKSIIDTVRSKKTHPQLEFFDETVTVNEELKKVDEFVKLLYSNTVDPAILKSFEYVEFTDGVYWIRGDQFMRTNQIEDLGLDPICFIRFEQSYRYITSSEETLIPKQWLKWLRASLKIRSQENTELFLEKFGMFINRGYVDKVKTKVVGIQGPSNTGKTIMVTKVFEALFGDSINYVTTGEFGFDKLLQTNPILIADEFKYDPKQLEELLKLFNNEKFLKKEKFKSNLKLAWVGPSMLIGNDLSKLLKKDSLANRITFFELIKSVEIESGDIGPELSKILVYTNRKYLSRYKTKPRQFRKRLIELGGVKEGQYGS